MQLRKWESEYRTTVVCIDSYDDRVAVGRFYNQSCSDGVHFKSTVEFLLKMEEVLDEVSIPQSFATVRTFREPARLKITSLEEMDVYEGALCTFVIRILFRQNASWQGSITWLEGGKEEAFRSVLEFLLLMDSAIAGTDSEKLKQEKLKSVLE